MLSLLPGGRILVAVESVDGPAARFTLAGRKGYTRVAVADSNGAYAWAQPVFVD